MSDIACIETDAATSRADPLANLRPVFDGDAPVFMVTDPALRDALCARGIEALMLDAHGGDDLAPPSVVLVISDAATLVMTETLRDRFASARTVVVPTAAFDPSTRASLYTVERMLASDFVASTERICRWRDALRRLPSPIVFVDPQRPERELRCHLLGDLSTNGRESHVVEVGEFVGVAAFFELEMESFGSTPTLFSVEGALTVTGMLTARAANMPSELYEQHAVAERTVHDFASRWRRAVLLCEDNRPVRLEPDVVGVDAADDNLLGRILDATGPAYTANLVELSIGTNVTPGLAVDWSVNSCMNEGLRGIHLGVGDGVNGSHVDFVSAGTNPKLAT